jgi:hypothetical protein
VVLLEADEDDVEAWREDDERVRGYAPYLIQPTESHTTPMEGTLGGDAVERRTGGRMDAGRPS